MRFTASSKKKGCSFFDHWFKKALGGRRDVDAPKFKKKIIGKLIKKQALMDLHQSADTPRHIEAVTEEQIKILRILGPPYELIYGL